MGFEEGSEEEGIVSVSHQAVDVVVGRGVVGEFTVALYSFGGEKYFEMCDIVIINNEK